MTIQDLYNYIIENYGKRSCWISDLSQALGIPYDDANYLTFVMGYRRGKATSVISSQVFAKDSNVRRIHSLL